MSKRQYHYDLLRIFATFSVVTLHVTSKQWYLADVESSSWHVLNFYDTLVRFSVPIFFMLSGVLFLNPEQHFSMKKILSKNIPRLAIAFLFWSCVYTRYHYVRGILDYNETAIHYRILTGNYHQWFVLCLIGMYLTLPILREIAQKKETLEYFLTLSFLLQNLIPFFYTNEDIAYYVGGVMQMGHVHMMTGYTGYFLLGYYLKTYLPPKKIRILLYLLGILALQFTFYQTNLLSQEAQEPVEFYYGYLLPTTFVVSCGIFLFFTCLDGKIPPKIERSVCQLSTLSFGIYQCHDLFLVCLLEDRFWLSWDIPTFWMVPLFSMAVFGLSGLLTYCISCVPVLNKYLV